MIRVNLGHQVEIGHVLCTFYDPATKVHRQALRAVKERFDGRVLDTVIPKNVEPGIRPFQKLIPVQYSSGRPKS